MDDNYERIISVKPEVFVYKIPPRQSARAYRAADWKLDQPDWTGRLRIVNINNKCIIKLEDRTSGELFAEAPVEVYPGPTVEAVADSSRYFVIKIVDPSGRHAFIGIGFADRGDSFDFNVSLQDHFKREKAVEEVVADVPTGPKVDLSFKEGQTIKINLGSRSTPGQEAKARPKPSGGGMGILPPPPSGTIPKLAAPGRGAAQQQPAAAAVQQPAAPAVQQPAAAAVQPTATEWGDFSSSNADAAQGWVQF